MGKHIGLYSNKTAYKQDGNLLVPNVSLLSDDGTLVYNQSEDFVDLGLPSGLLWDKKNLGATNQEDAGQYFSWANIVGHPSSDTFTQNVYNQTEGKNLQWNIGKDNDAARAILGKPWRMPSKADFQELMSNCDSEWTSINGKNGRKFTSKINGNSIFLPAAGFVGDGGLGNFGIDGYYWSSPFNTNGSAWRLGFYDGGVGMGSSSRSYGLSVRAVQ